MRGQFPILVGSAMALGPYLTVQKTVEHRHEEALKGRGESEGSQRGMGSYQPRLPQPTILQASVRRILTHAGTNIVHAPPPHPELDWQGSGRW